MIVRLERVVPFPRAAVYAWWTDFREDDHRSRRSPASSRREVLRREGNEVWLRDDGRRPVPVTLDEHVTLNPPNGYVVEARYPGADVGYEYRFEPSANGTRISLVADLRPRHVGRVVLPLFRRRVQRYAERDTEYHLCSMSQDLMSPASDRGLPR